MPRSIYTKAWFVERYKAPLLAQRRYRRAYFRSITPKVKPGDTIGMVVKELAVLWAADYHPDGPAKLWPTLTRLARVFAGTHYVRAVHAERRVLLALLQRLLDEKKVLRHRRSNTIFLSDLGLQRLYALRGIKPWARGDPLVVPAGTTLDDFLASPESFPIDGAASGPTLCAPVAQGPGAAAPAPAPPQEPVADYRRGEGAAWRSPTYVV
jgi:hypothetical protein